MNTNLEQLSFEEVRSGVRDEVSEGGRKRPFCTFVCMEALEEMKRHRRERPFSRLFYELAFFHREEKCLGTAYQVWRPVMRKWIICWDYELMPEHMDDVVDELFYATFEAVFDAVIQNRFTDFEAGKVHNFLKRTLHLKVFDRFRRVKRAIISRLNEDRNNLEGSHLRFLRERVLPRFREVRSALEAELFERYLLDSIPVREMAKDDALIRGLGDVSSPVKALHNRIQTMLWNVYKLLKREDARSESPEYRNLLSSWTRIGVPGAW